MKICNIKISLKFKHPFYKKEKSKKKIVSKVKSWTMIQYLHTPNLVNLTGLKSSDEVVHAIDFIERLKLQCRTKTQLFGIFPGKVVFSHAKISSKV